jgi:alkanesulfonate monooxygenase SsuD/methylene tetrahydromethanopterin reductase-like flavin-dependent oxidoreductase (luciferase family)
MKFGIFLPMSGALSNVKTVVGASRAAEELGYDSAWVYDMSLTQTRDNYRNNLVCGCWEDIDPDGKPEFVEPFTTMAAIASSTDSITIGSAVIQLPLYNPLVVARQAANIDILSEGRLTLGVGIGSRINFFRAGYDRLHFPFKKRGAIFDEYLKAIRQLWTAGAPSSFAGRYVQFSDLELFPKPISQRIWIGSGVADKGLRRVVEFGDGVIFPYRPPAETKANVAKIREEAPKNSRSASEIEIAQTIFTCLGKTSEEARALLTPTITVHAKGFGGKAMSTDELAQHAKHTVSTQNLMDMSLVGTRGEIVRRLEEFVEAGLQHAVLAMIFRGRDLKSMVGSMRVFAEEVLLSF